MYVDKTKLIYKMITEVLHFLYYIGEKGKKKGFPSLSSSKFRIFVALF